MQRKTDMQEANSLDPIEVRIKALRHSYYRKQYRIAKRLRISEAAVSRAYKGELPTILKRIDRLLASSKN